MTVADLHDLVGATERYAPGVTDDPRPDPGRDDAEFIRQSAARFPLLTAAQVAGMPPAEPILKNLIARGDIGAIHGGWGDGKSFVALDLLEAVAAGRDWFGFRCRRPVPTLYIGLEGQGGVPKRVRALQEVKGISGNFRFLLTSLDIRDPVDRAQLVASIRHHGFEGGVLCLDTYNASTRGMAENTAEDTGAAIAAAIDLQREFGGVVMFVHHSGKNREQGMRGHSSLEGACDFIIEVARDPTDRSGARSITVRKVKEGEDGAEFGFLLKRVALGDDEDGDEVSSAVVERVLTRAEQAATHVGAMLQKVEGARAEEVVKDGFRRLVELGITPTNTPNSHYYLPRQLLELSLHQGLGKEELNDAMRRLVGRAVFTIGTVGQYDNRTSRKGLILNERTTP